MFDSTEIPLKEREEGAGCRALVHRLYGLLLASNEPLPGVSRSLDADAKIDVRVHLKPATWPLGSGASPERFYVSRTKDEKGNPTMELGFLGSHEHIVLRYSDGTQFVLESHGRDVFADWPDQLSLADTVSYLVGPVMGLVLRLHGTVPLHASAVAIGDHAVAFAGPAGAGKSTIAAAFAQQGYRVVSDDVVALCEESAAFVIPPGYPRINLWSESVAAILGKDVSLPPICPTFDKCFMPLNPETQFEARSLPLGGIYILHSHAAGPVKPALRPLRGTEAFVALLANTYMNYLPDRARRLREFQLLGRVLARVPLRCVEAAEDLSRLPDLCEAIARDAAGLLTDSTAGLSCYTADR